jgi:hypothetical protein
VTAPTALTDTPTAAEVAAKLAESDRRDRELRAWLDALGMGHHAAAAGRAKDWQQGYERAHADLERDWHAIADPASRNATSHAELEARRYGPGGREHFGDSRPGDFPGRAAARRAG